MTNKAITIIADLFDLKLSWPFRTFNFDTLQHLLLLAFLSVLLSACQTAPKQTVYINNDPNFWSMSGKIGIKDGKKAQSGYIDWYNQNDFYQINIHGTLGMGKAKIVKNQQGVELTTGKKSYRAQSAKELSSDMLGMDIPIEGLQYWIKATPYPNSEIQQQTEYLNGQLASLTQDGWYIQYQRYSQSHPELPEKIKATRDSIQITLIIKKWGNEL